MIYYVWLPRGIVIPRFFWGRLAGIKIRRPRPGEALAKSLQPAPSSNPRKMGKFISVRGSQHGLFGADTWLGYPDLLLTEGEWDCMLAWQTVGDLCDVGTLGAAGQGLGTMEEEIALYEHQRLWVVYDADQAGEAGRRRFEQMRQATGLSPPDHDLTDYWKKGGDLRGWVRERILVEDHTN